MMDDEGHNPGWKEVERGSHGSVACFRGWKDQWEGILCKEVKKEATATKKRSKNAYLPIVTVKSSKAGLLNFSNREKREHGGP